MSVRFARYSMFIAFVALLAAVAWQRAYWAQVTQWREDQACNLWLGYTQPLSKLPVGLISSVGTPNPNGMPLLAELFSKLPNLWAVSSVLGVLQAAILVWACWTLLGRSFRFALVVAPLLSSVLLTATSVEFWNNWILTSFNLAFFACYMRYQRTRSLWPIAGCVLLMLLAPAVYLAGLVNALVYCLFTALLLLRKPPPARSFVGLCGNVPPLLAAVCIAGFMHLVTWQPYAEVMSGKPLPSAAISGRERFARVLEAALDFPRWSLVHWFKHSEQSFLQSNGAIIGARGMRLLELADTLLLLQAALALVALTVVLGRRVLLSRTALVQGMFRPESAWQGRMLLTGIAFVWLSLAMSPLVGGPTWSRSERVDQQVQFFPFVMLACFALPLLLRLPCWLRDHARRVTIALAVSFTLVNLIAGRTIVRAHLTYDGDELSSADVPLAQQRRVARFIAEDWRRFSTSDKVPVFYKHGQDWVIDFGRSLLPYYPAPMVVGRAIDYELRRAYGLSNSQEGIQKRSPRDARYIVTYAARSEPEPRGHYQRVMHHKLGRLRVTVLEQ